MLAGSPRLIVIGGQQRPRLRQAEQLPDAAAGPLGLEIPQRGIEGVARGASRHQAEQIGAAGAGRHGIGLGKDRCDQ